jgi:hypothetical protein
VFSGSNFSPGRCDPANHHAHDFLALMLYLSQIPQLPVLKLRHVRK